MGLISRYRFLHSRQADRATLAWSDRGSVLLLCLVFLTAVSAVALAALETAWSGQKMISSYVNHQQTFLRLEHGLLASERQVWQVIGNSGIAQFLSTSHYPGNLHADSLVKTYGDWIDTEFSQQQCGPLFEVSVPLVRDANSSAVGLSVRWDVCCENEESCIASEFTQRRRLWTRSVYVAGNGM